MSKERTKIPCASFISKKVLGVSQLRASNIFFARDFRCFSYTILGEGVPVILFSTRDCPAIGISFAYYGMQITFEYYGMKISFEYYGVQIFSTIMGVDIFRVLWTADIFQLLIADLV
jgi:hypothetical protein